jgi:hypothetical protein
LHVGDWPVGAAGIATSTSNELALGGFAVAALATGTTDTSAPARRAAPAMNLKYDFRCPVMNNLS